MKLSLSKSETRTAMVSRKALAWRVIALLALVCALASTVAQPTEVSATHQAGYNVCLKQGHNVYKSATFNSEVVGWVSYYDVWHHYYFSGNWSLGYVRTTSIQGYIPSGLFEYRTGHDALSCH